MASDIGVYRERNGIFTTEQIAKAQQSRLFRLEGKKNFIRQLFYLGNNAVSPRLSNSFSRSLMRAFSHDNNLPEPENPS